MKIRNGFVSNSSSSSFCIIADKDIYEKALENISDELEKACIKYYLGGRETKSFPMVNDGKPVMFFNREVSNEDCWFDNLEGYDDDELYDYDPSQVLYEFCKKMKEIDSDKVIYDDYC